MGFRIKAKDITVEVDTLDELHGVLAMLGALQGKTKSPGLPKDSSPAMSLPFTSEAPEMATQLSNLYRQLAKGHALTILQALYGKPEGLTSEELKKILSFATDSGFGGALGGITKAAKRYGLKGEDIVSKPKEGGTHYRLTPSMREVILSEIQREEQHN